MLPRILLPLALLLIGANSAEIVGKYTFQSQDNFDNFLVAADVPLLRRTIMAKTQPDITIEKEGDEYFFTNITPLKTLKISFVPGVPKEFDILGSEQPAEFVTTIENEDTIVTKKTNDDTFQVSRKFNEDGFVMTFQVKGVTATRTFKRV